MAAAASRRHLAGVRLLALDVDGTLTDGAVRYLGSRELVSFHVHDGAALEWLQRAGVAVAWISGRGSPAVRHRARELGVRHVHLRVADKRACLAALQRRLGVSAAETAAMGDDLADLAMASCAAWFAAPADARPAVRARADFVAAAGAGRGAVREVCELLLRSRRSPPRPARASKSSRPRERKAAGR
jgi:3-deoxy-D-manno-octulosonate 8-phosphate phosphatase (KDO 8-P phosphatase)